MWAMDINKDVYVIKKKKSLGCDRIMDPDLAVADSIMTLAAL